MTSESHSRRQIPAGVVATLLFVVSFVPRLLWISIGPYSVDTLNLALKAEQLVTTLQLSYSFGSGYPLTIVCGGIFVLLGKIVGVHDPVLAVNFMSVVMGAACVLLLYQVTRRLIDRDTAFFAAFFLSVTPIFLAVSTYGLSHTPALFFLLTGINFLLRFRDSGRGRDLVVAAAFIGFLGAARLQNLVLMAVPLAFLLWTVSTRDRLRTFLVFGSVAAAAMSIFYLPYLIGSERAAYLAQFVKYKEASVIPHASIGLLFKPLLNILYHIIYTFTPVGIMLIFIGGWKLSKQRGGPAYLFLMLWLLFPVLLYSRLYTLVPRFLTILHPPLCILMACFFSHNCAAGRFRRILAMLLAVVMAVGMVCMVEPVLTTRHRQATIPEYVRWVARLAPPDARIITVDDSLFFRYYSNLNLLSRFHDQYRIDEEAHAAFRRELDGLLNSGIPVYVTEHGLYNYDPQGRFAAMMTEGYRLDSVGVRPYEFWQESCWQSGRYPRQLFRVWPKP